MTDVVVVGGGLAGLVAARRLQTNGAEVTLLERESEVGGRIRSRREDGFIFDRGFQVLFTAYPAVQEELDLSELSLRAFRPGATLARPGERSILSDPLGDPKAATDTLFNRNITLADKLRILTLRRTLSRQSSAELLEHDDRTIEQYLRAEGFSDAFLENFAKPFYGGITLDRSLSNAQFVFEYTFKMLATGQTVVPAMGMGEITRQLAERARNQGVSIETDTTVEQVRTDGETVTVETATTAIEADAVIVATEPDTARTLTGCEIQTESRGCVTQYFSLPRRQQLRTDRRLVLNVANERPNQVAPLSDVAPTYAPSDKHLLSATFLGQQDQSDEELATAVQESLQQWYPENNFADLKLLRTERISFAQVAQPPGFRASRPSVDDPDGPVYLAGDYTEWSSIQGALKSGQRVARTVTRQVC